MAHVGQPAPPRLVPALGHVVAELDVLAAVEPEPGLLEGVLRRVRVRRDVAHHVLETALAVFLWGCGGGGEGAREDVHCEGRQRAG